MSSQYQSRNQGRMLKRRKWVLHGLNLTVLTIVVTFQACSKNYDVSVQSVGLPPKCRDGQCKTSEIQPGVEVVRPPTKVLFVVDNSRTMSLSQAYLANGAKTLAKELHGFDVDFYLYSTSDRHNKRMMPDGTAIDKDDKPVVTSAPVQSCKWKENGADGGIIENTGAVCPNNRNTTYALESILQVGNSLSTDLSFRNKDSEEGLEAASEKLARAITSVGVDGDSTETGLCTLVRSVYNESASKIFNKNDNAAMVIVSDEDDFSSPLTCLSKTTQEETFRGKDPVTRDCNPQSEVCDSVNYEVKFGPVATGVPYAEVKANYSCQQEASNICPEGAGNCTRVTYNYSALRSKVRYSCLNKVDYKVNFDETTTYSRTLNYSCFSKVPYQIQFEPLPTYTQSLSHQCELLEDGVPVATSTPVPEVLAGAVPACVNGAEVACEASALSAATTRCGSQSRVLAGSCKQKCIVGSQNVEPVVFEDTDSVALGRDLITTGFSLNGTSYVNLSDWVAKIYPLYTMKSVGGITRMDSDSGAVNPSPLAGLTSSCVHGTLVDCDGSQLTTATNSCTSIGRKITPDSCKVQCLAQTITPLSVTYSDTRTDADSYDLRTSSFLYQLNGQTYSDVEAWGNAIYTPKTVSSVAAPAVMKTPESEVFYNEHCSTQDTVGVDCTQGSAAMAQATAACGSKRVVVCKKKCLSETKSLQLSNLAEDVVNFCSNSSSTTKFTVAGNQFSTIQHYQTSLYATGGTAQVMTCARSGNGYTSVPQTALMNSVSKTSCDEDYSNVFNFTSKCKGTNPKQNGVTSGSIAYTCTQKINTVEVKPALTKILNYIPKGTENLCSEPQSAFKVGDVTYPTFSQYVMTLEGRTDVPIACQILPNAKKTEVPSGVISAGIKKQDWTFDFSLEDKSTRHVPTDSPDANLERAFLSKASYLFGDNGFFVSAIIRDEQEDSKETNCIPLGADQSTGKKYRTLVETVGSRTAGVKGDVTSICATDYSKALNSVSSWIKENASRTIFMPDVKEKDEILAVSLVTPDTGAEQVLTVGVDFEVVGNKVNFINPAVDPKGRIIKYVFWVPKVATAAAANDGLQAK